MTYARSSREAQIGARSADMRSAAAGPAVSSVLTRGGPAPPCAIAVRLPAAKGTTKVAVSFARSLPPVRVRVRVRVVRKG